MTVYLSGIQPTGRFHIGNYFGCIKPFISVHSKHSAPKKNIFLIADMHCYTKPENVINVKQNVIEAVRSLLAAGIDPERTHIVQQSKISEHANLAWYLSCLTKYTRAESMTQFKTNSKNHPNVGLFIYPILQAADILIYEPDYVMVGPDQRQHLELASELTDRANNFSGATIFKKPKIISSNLKIKSLKNGENKMSKSDPDGCLFITDEPNLVAKKVMKAKTDNIFGITYDSNQRKALSNLIEIFSVLRNVDAEEVVAEFKNCGHQIFKEKLVNELKHYFDEIRCKYNSISEIFIHDVLYEGTRQASKMAASKLNDFLGHINK